MVGPTDEPGPGPIILFDGVCNLCHRSVQFVLPRDKKGVFRFASLQSPVGQALLKKYGLSGGQTDSFVLVEKDRAYTRSSAALQVVKKLKGGWPLLTVFWIVPRPLRDFIYDYVARHRYQWFGKAESCWLPTPTPPSFPAPRP
jgi:predicted DCC family thiol-disulfide oxidoreductase YuxK